MMTIEEKAKAYDKALEKAKKYRQQLLNEDNPEWASEIEELFPKLKQSEDEKIRKEIIDFIYDKTDTYELREKSNSWLAWLEKQDGQKPTKCRQETKPNGGIVYEDFNEGNGYYKLHLDYLNKKQIEEIEEMIRTWNKEPKTSDENIKNCIGMCLTDVDEQRFRDYNTSLKEALAWLENQGKEEYALKSSKDEDVRKFMQYIGKQAKAYEFNLPNRSYDIYAFAKDILAWLEKQGEQQKTLCDKCRKEHPSHSCQDITALGRCAVEYEQKPADKPKFHEGDWVLNNVCLPTKIISIEDGMYVFDDNSAMSISFIDENYHLWTIQDARDGDMLSYVTDEEDLWIMIYWSLYEPYEGHVHYHALLVNDNFSDKGTCCICIDNLKPATKEQRDTLERAMTNAGYTFDFEKKELKKIENDLTEFENTLADVCRGWIGEEIGWKDYIIKNSFPLLELAKKQFDEYEQKPTWSEEDEDYINDLIKYFSQNERLKNTKKDIVIWLKSLKPKKQWVPTIEHAEALSDIIREFGLEENKYLLELKEQIDQMVYVGSISVSKQ